MLTTTPRISRPSPWATLTAGFTALILIFASFVPAPANADDDIYAFCRVSSRDNYSGIPFTYYFSAIFRTQTRDMLDPRFYNHLKQGKSRLQRGFDMRDPLFYNYMKGFYNYLKGEGFDVESGSRDCVIGFYSNVKLSFEHYASPKDSSPNTKYVRTNWKPDTVPAPANVASANAAPANVASANAAPAKVADDKYIYCVVTSLPLNLTERPYKYYSALFLGDFSPTDSPRLTHAFGEYLQAKYSPQNHTISGGTCTFGSFYAVAQPTYEQEIRSDEQPSVGGRPLYQQVVRTNWAPDNLSPDAFSPQPLRDFNITLSSGQREVQVCVRDHECEDGDQIQVAVNGESLFYGELFNSWDCTNVPVQQGRNRVQLYAVNGSGNKGNCSYQDVNTGEIQVRGTNSQTQTWRHRGGAGSSANIIVEVE